MFFEHNIELNAVVCHWFVNDRSASVLMLLQYFHSRLYYKYYLLCFREGWCPSMHSVQSAVGQVSAVTPVASVTCATVWVKGRRSDPRCTSMQHMPLQVCTQPLHTVSSAYLSKCKGQDQATKASARQMD
jgi:hypothetical protein